MTNAVNYIRINTEEQVKWACSSEADRLVHKLYVFTKLTSNRKSIFADRWFEWSQRDIRSFVGKTVFKGYEGRLRTVCALLPQMVAAKQHGASSLSARETVAAAAETESLTTGTIAVTKVSRSVLESLEKSPRRRDRS